MEYSDGIRLTNYQDNRILFRFTQPRNQEIMRGIMSGTNPTESPASLDNSSNRSDQDEFVSAVLNGKQAAFRFTFPGDTVLSTINSSIARLLARDDKAFLLDTVITILREMILNAVKANAKRQFFDRLDLDINDSRIYNSGMRIFKDSIIGDLISIREEIETAPYNVTLRIKKDESGITISVTNNISILPDELDRIRERIQSGISSSDFNSSYEEVYDPTEGAGLGILLIILLLRNAGIKPNNYTILNKQKSFTSQIKIPEIIRPVEIQTEIKKQILRDVEFLPAFPENILQIQALCNNPESTIDQIASKIVIDPSLTADVLRISNSAGFITGKRIKNINEAIMLIGLRNLNSILTAAAARKILDTRFRKFEQIWQHCNKVAFYSRGLAAALGLNGIVDHVFISGLLHDIGKIVLLSTDQTLLNRLSEIVADKKIRSSTILEEISIGISHSSIGALIANKWNFPDYLIDAINYHHSPLDAEESYAPIVAIVYSANLFAGIESRKYAFTYMENEILDRYFRPHNHKPEELFEKLRSAYLNHAITIQAL